MEEKKKLSKMCLNKRRYPTEKDARFFGDFTCWSGGGPMRIYECPHCDGYHLTSQGVPNDLHHRA